MKYEITSGMLQGEFISTDGDTKLEVLTDLAEVMQKHQITRLNVYINPFEFHIINKEEIKNAKKTD